MLSLTTDILDDMIDNKGINHILQLRYRGVQAANIYMQSTEPRVKLKSADTADEAKQHLEFLLYVIKQLSLLSAPFLLEGFAKIQHILGNDTISNVSTAVSGTTWSEARNLEEFDVTLSPDILYQKLEPAG